MKPLEVVNAGREVFNRHHAFLCVGDEGMAREYLAGVGISPKELGADYTEIIESPLSIETVRKIHTALSVRPIKDRVVVNVFAKTLAHESMHALLKICEEPQGNNAFVLVTRDSETLIPTLRSRFLEVFRSSTIFSPTLQKEAIEFKRASVKNRLVLIKKYIEEGRESALVFADALHEVFRPLLKDYPREFSELVLVRSYLTDSSSSTKQLLEYISGVLPRK